MRNKTIFLLLLTRLTLANLLIQQNQPLLRQQTETPRIIISLSENQNESTTTLLSSSYMNMKKRPNSQSDYRADSISGYKSSSLDPNNKVGFQKSGKFKNLVVMCC